MTHTPGPWERQGWLIVNPQNDGLILDGRMKRPKSLFESFVWDSKRSIEEQTANIILAESAPELLEACKAALSELEHAHSVTNDAFNECDGAMQAMLINVLPEREDSVIPKLTTAIAKAEPPQ